MDREHELLREASYWKDLLIQVVLDMEETAKKETEPQRKRWFESRAKRLRERLAGTVPPKWTKPPRPGW